MLCDEQRIRLRHHHYFLVHESFTRARSAALRAALVIFGSFYVQHN
jgi:hypothetical protein